MHRLNRRIVPGLGAVVLLGIGFVVGQAQTGPLAAQPAGKGVVPAASSAAPVADKRVIAYIYGTTPITREEFGDYLIQQFGAERVRLFVNRKIIEHAAAQQKIVVTPEAIDAVINDDCGKLGMDKQRFIKEVLANKYGKTVQEWREDVIKPRLILKAMCAGQINFGDADLKKIYDNMYGEKVQCRIILWAPDQRQDAFRKYDEIRKSDAAFDAAARSQLHSDLAARAGYVDAIGRNSGPGTAKIEEIAFALEDGKLSEVIDTPGGAMVIKRVGIIPAKKDVTFEKVKPLLIKELTERQLEQEIPKVFAKLNAEAKPLFILSPKNLTREEEEDQSKRILGADPGKMERKQ